MASSEKWLLGDNSMNVITHSNHANVQQELADAKQWMELIFFLSNSAGVCSVTARIETSGLTCGLIRLTYSSSMHAGFCLRFQSFQWLLGHDTLLRIDRCENAPARKLKWQKYPQCFPATVVEDSAYLVQRFAKATSASPILIRVQRSCTFKKRSLSHRGYNHSSYNRTSLILDRLCKNIIG